MTLRVELPAEWSACCTCPVFRRTGACRHVWAVVLEADERGLALAGAADGEADPTYTALDPASELWRTRLAGVRESLAEAAPDPWEGLVPRRATAWFRMLDEAPACHVTLSQAKLRWGNCDAACRLAFHQ